MQQHYVFWRKQVLAGDVQDFLDRWNPERFTAQRLRRAFGYLSVELEDVANCGDAFTVPEARHLVGRLWGGCPWLGFYLAHDKPFGSATTVGRFPFLAIGLCLTDMVLVARDKSGRCDIAANQYQLGAIKAQYLSGLGDMCRRAQMPAAALEARSAEITRQIGLLLNDKS